VTLSVGVQMSIPLPAIYETEIREPAEPRSVGALERTANYDNEVGPGMIPLPFPAQTHTRFHIEVRKTAPRVLRGAPIQHYLEDAYHTLSVDGSGVSGRTTRGAWTFSAAGA
jgi:hypothetical protein